MSTLYGHPLSQPCRAVQWYIDYADKDIEVKTVDILAGEQKKPEYLAKFPMGQVPAFEDGDLCVAQSTAILQYIADGDELAPKDLKERAKVQEYMGIHHTVVRKLSTDCFLKAVFAETPKEAKEEFEKGLVEIRPILEKYDALLGKQKYIVGDELSLGDFMFATEVDQLAFIRPDALADFKNITAYLKRMEDVKGYKKCRDTAADVTKTLLEAKTAK